MQRCARREAIHQPSLEFPFNFTIVFTKEGYLRHLEGLRLWRLWSEPFHRAIAVFNDAVGATNNEPCRKGSRQVDTQFRVAFQSSLSFTRTLSSVIPTRLSKSTSGREGSSRTAST